MTVKERLIETLQPLGYDVILEGSLSPKDYPDSFITFWNFTSSNTSFDNEDMVTEYGFNIRFYSKSPIVVEENKRLILITLKKAGFIPDGRGNDFSFNQETLHLGWSIDVYFMEENDE